MKKLMFAAALAATGMTFAATPAAQVYDVSLSIKTTAAAVATINSKTNPFVGEEKEEVVYRKQASKSWKGLIWGCNCEAIDGVWEEVNEVLESDYSTIKGCIIWDTKTKQPVYIGNGSDFSDLYSAQGAGFEWDFLQAIDKNGKKCEGVWTMVQTGVACEESFELFNFKGAGFGTLNLGSDCNSYVKSISGNFAGSMKAPTAEIDDNWSGCVFCGYTKEEGSCEFATAWNYCECDDYLDLDHTAAYGTWSVKYNSGLSQKLSKPVKITDKGLQNFTVSIRDVYNFNSLPLVAATIASIENTFWEINPCDEYEAAIAEAQSRVDTAKAAQEAVTFENLTQAVKDAKEDLAKALVKSNSCDMAYEAAKSSYDTASKALVKAEDAVSTNKYEILIKNEDGSQVFNGPVYGSKAAAEKIALYYELAYKRTIKVTAYTLDRTSTILPWVINPARTVDTTDLTKAWIDANSAKWATDDAADLVKAQTEYNTAKENRDTKKSEYEDAKKAVESAEAKVAIAENNLKNITYLQVEAAKAVQNAEDLLALAKKAAENAGCAD